MVLISIIKGHLLIFCRTTSVKGVPRIVAASKHMKVIWFLAVLGFLSTASYEVYNTVSEYLAYPTTRIMTERIVSTIDTIEVPLVTICNANPLSSDADDIAVKEGIPTYENFMHQADNVFSCAGCSDAERDAVGTVHDSVSKMNLYYQTLGDEAAFKVGHQQQMMFADIKALHLKGYTLQAEQSFYNIQIQPVKSSNFFNCYKLSIIPEQYKFYLGFSMVLYIDNFSNSSNGVTVADDIGIRVSVDAPLTTPFNKADTQFLRPGTASNIQVFPARRLRLPAPYGDCQEDKSFAEEFSSINNASVYSKKACTSKCIEEYVLEECGCRDASMLNLLTQRGERAPFCEDISLPQKQLLDNIKCLQSKRKLAIEQCNTECTFPCDEVVYDTTLSSSVWPVDYGMKWFHLSHIKHKPYANRFGSDAEWQVSRKSKLVRDNFLHVSVHIADYLVYKYIEKAAITLPIFLSRLGGALNLWSGITVIVIMEVIEMLLKILSDAFCTRKIDDD